MFGKKAPKQGWYPDNADRALERYWDGAAWTDQTRAAGQAPERPTTRGEQKRQTRERVRESSRRYDEKQKRLEGTSFNPLKDIAQAGVGEKAAQNLERQAAAEAARNAVGGDGIARTRRERRMAADASRNASIQAHNDWQAHNNPNSPQYAERVKREHENEMAAIAATRETNRVAHLHRSLHQAATSLEGRIVDAALAAAEKTGATGITAFSSFHLEDDHVAFTLTDDARPGSWVQDDTWIVARPLPHDLQPAQRREKGFPTAWREAQDAMQERVVDLLRDRLAEKAASKATATDAHAQTSRAAAAAHETAVAALAVHLRAHITPRVAPDTDLAFAVRRINLAATGTGRGIAEVRYWDQDSNEAATIVDIHDPTILAVLRSGDHEAIDTIRRQMSIRVGGT